ncbi:hypothetical protein KP509_12G041400 [Ceratopteris richardii]|nr:hypothetical protein KP509_12G041400 [Ceratopteris richardii]KAH7423153.1 hypothetical protein KP509_12G041400 [Ceratopteris richardii]
MLEVHKSQGLANGIHNLLAFDLWKDQNLVDRIQKQSELLHQSTAEELEDVRDEINRYRPGSGVHKVGGVSHADFDIPEVITLLVVGPEGAGKSSLINNMIRVLKDVTSGFSRAQIYGYRQSGSMFLQEYLLHKHFCVFDSRGFSNINVLEDLNIVKNWMSNGVCHGEPVCRPSDDMKIREDLEGRGRQGNSGYTLRKVNFVIFVVNACKLQQMREQHDVAALENLVLLYRCPYLTFMDDVPVVVMTHGDKLDPHECILARIFLGKLFGVSPVDQVFDIPCFTERTVHPEDVHAANDLALLKMLQLSLEQADTNLPCKEKFTYSIRGVLKSTSVQLGIWQLLYFVILFCLLFEIIITIIHSSKPTPWFRNIFKYAHKKPKRGH